MARLPSPPGTTANVGDAAAAGNHEAGRTKSTVRTSSPTARSPTDRASASSARYAATPSISVSRPASGPGAAGSMTRIQLATTSLARIGVPSLKVMPGRRRKVSREPASETSQSSASAGRRRPSWSHVVRPSQTCARTAAEPASPARAGSQVSGAAPSITSSAPSGRATGSTDDGVPRPPTNMMARTAVTTISEMSAAGTPMRATRPGEWWWDAAVSGGAADVSGGDASSGRSRSSGRPVRSSITRAVYGGCAGDALEAPGMGLPGGSMEPGRVLPSPRTGLARRARGLYQMRSLIPARAPGAPHGRRMGR
jgi:hypothetical protein